MCQAAGIFLVILDAPISGMPQIATSQVAQFLLGSQKSHVSRINCEKSDKLFGMNNANLGECDMSENVKMVVTCDDIIRVCCNRTIDEFVVVRISGNEAESVGWVNWDDKR